MKRINWRDHLVNLVVVITGITIAFWLNKLSENAKENRQREAYINSMINDLEIDINDLDTLIIGDSAKFNAFRGLLALPESNLSSDSLYQSYREVVSLIKFSGHNIAFESIKFSGRFELISDVSLRLDIIENYHEAYSQIQEVEKYYQMNFDEYIIPFLIKQPLVNDYEQDKEILSDPEFRTILEIQKGLLAQKIASYANTKSTTKNLKEKLEESVK